MTQEIVRATPLYMQIAQQIRSQIVSGQLTSGARLPSEAALCQQYGASRVTVRKAIDSLVKAGVVRAQVGKGTFVQPTSAALPSTSPPQDRAASPATLTDLVGFISIGDITPFALDILHGIQNAADRDDTHVIFASADYDRRQQARHVAALRSRMVGGLLILPTFEADAQLQQLAAESYPAVLIDRYFDDVALPCVTSDNYEGSYQGARYLLDLGHRSIAFIAQVPMSTSQERLAGYQAALATYGVASADHLTLRLDSVPSDESQVLATGHPQQSIAYVDVRQFLEQRRPSAVICHNQYFALLTITALHDLGLRVAEDVSLISFDRDVQRSVSERPLTVVTQNGFTIGSTAFTRLQRALAGMADGPQIMRLPMRLVIHQSCRRFSA